MIHDAELIVYGLCEWCYSEHLTRFHGYDSSMPKIRYIHVRNMKNVQ